MVIRWRAVGRSFGVVWRVWTTEGTRAVRDRALDRWAEGARRRSFAVKPPTYRPPRPVPVLNLAASPLAARFGGNAAQHGRRLAAESAARDVAVLFPWENSWRLEIDPRGGRGERFAVHLSGPAQPALRGDVALDDRALADSLELATAICGARAVHVEGLAGIPLRVLAQLQRAGLKLIVSLHDFAAFCPRPHLFEQPQGRFCGYCRDLERCGRCLAVDWPLAPGYQGERRRLASQILGAAEALVFPSDFQRRAHQNLFPRAPVERQWVIPPPPPSPLVPRRRAGPLRHVAFTGGAYEHKGVLLFEEVVRRLRGTGLRFTAYGGGDPKLLRRLRRLERVRVRGYYRAGSLPKLLRQDAVDAALILSVVPESYNIVLDECGAAGVPVIAFALGAVADRLPLTVTGALVDPKSGVDGILAALAELTAESEAPAPAQPVSDTRWATGHLELYGQLGLLEEGAEASARSGREPRRAAATHARNSSDRSQLLRR